MKKSIFPLCALLAPAAFAFVSADADSVTVARFPDANTVEVEAFIDISYRADGTAKERNESWTKILTEKGRRDERTQRIDYNRRTGTARFVSVGIVGTNGVERPVDFAASLKDTTDNSSVGANIYDPQDRQLVCSVPGLAVGETLHLVFEQEMTSPRVKDQWSNFELFESTQPLLRRTVRITAPAARPLRKIALRHPLGNVAYQTEPAADGGLVHTWCATNVPQAFPEPDMPPFYNEVQGLRVSTLASWPELSRWYWELCLPHLEKTNAAMTNLVERLGGDIPALFKFVSQEVRYMGLTLEDTSPGYEPHDVSLTFDNRYGVCRDKAALLVALLRLAGHDAYPVLINAGGKSDPEVPTTMFNHAIVAVRTPSSSPSTSPYTYTLMDPTDESSRDLYPSYLADCSYLVAHPQGETLRLTPVTPAEKNLLTVSVDGMLETDGSASAAVKIGFGGMNDTVFRHALLRKKPDVRRKLFERLAGACVPGAEILRLDIRPADLRDTGTDLAAELTVRLPELLLEGQTCRELTVPFLSPSLGLANWLFEGRTSLETRRFPLELSSTAAIEERVTLVLGEKLGAALSLPNEPAITGKYAFARSFAVTNGTLLATRSLAVSGVAFSTNEYAQLRENLKRVEARERIRPRFAPNALADADVRFRLLKTEVDCNGPDAWTVTNTVVREILTYDGKKRSAELKYPIHPAWKNVEIVSAVVSNRDGSVARLTPKEVNRLDSGWAAAAPRYPAGETLVVTLPRVEIGSVISTVVATTVTNAPASYYGSFLFDVTEPTDRLEVRVNDWHRVVDDPVRIPSEPRTPASSLWRDSVIISSNDFHRAAAVLRRAADVSSTTNFNSTLLAIRDWMAKYVKVVGPSLYELPLGEQLTDPEVVLKERYATRLDYVRTLCALLRGAGYEADVVFAANNAKEDIEIRQLNKFGKPNIRAYSLALCRVRVREGGFLWWGGELKKEYFLGTENEYTPIGATGYDRSDYFDPASGAFGMVSNVEDKYETKDEENAEFIVRENGAVDIAVKNLMFGAQVGAFRKKFAEILPEMRSRFYQSLLGDIAQAASATSELKTDTEGYPAETTFSCFVPDYATVDKDTISITLPPFNEVLPNLTGTVRETPIAVPATDPKVETVVVRFPEGYTEIEHLPEKILQWDEFLKCGIVSSEVSSEEKDGVLSVKIVRETLIPFGGFEQDKLMAGFLKDLRRQSSSRANRTITVRRGTRQAGAK